ncbi:hypothetical protein [Vulgatibacter sp.]|uniref:hypothetical protein n=1 Tax=Vulgatibacter sp. TaxID=1971226 RepID=UPI0035657B23
MRASNFRRLAFRAPLLALVLLLAACGSDGGDGADAAPLNTPARTPVGTPTGDAVAATIGAAGGTLETPDGAVRLEIPPGALSSDEEVSIQPITAEAPGAIGGAFRLRPEGVTFAQPVRFTLAWEDDEVAGTAPALLQIASQEAEGSWRAYEASAVDEASRTVSVDVEHFSDWSLVAGAVLSPQQATVKVGQNLELAVLICERVSDDETLLTSLVAKCQKSEILARFVGNWSVNGVPGGDATAGSVSKQADSTARYTAPGAVPSSNPVAVSAEYTGLEDGVKAILVANVTIEPAPCGGNDPLEPCRYELAKFEGQSLPYEDLPREEWENPERVVDGALTLDDFDGDGEGTWMVQYTWIEERDHDELEHVVQVGGYYEPGTGGSTSFEALGGPTFQGTIDDDEVQLTGFPFYTSNATLDVALTFTR